MGISKMYEAKVIRAKFEGNNLPTIEELVKNKILSCNTRLKKQEIDESIFKEIEKEMGAEIGFPVSYDDSISSATSLALKKLKSEGIVRNSSHGYWENN